VAISYQDEFVLDEMEPDDAGAAGLVKMAEYRIADAILKLWEGFGLGEDGFA